MAVQLTWQCASLASCLKLAAALLALPCLPQVSALNVWGTPLEVACRAADLAVALPTRPLLQEIYRSGYPVSIHSKMLAIMVGASQLLKSSAWTSPYMSQAQLAGGVARSVVVVVTVVAVINICLGVLE
jgi:hypothetical protein